MKTALIAPAVAVAAMLAGPAAPAGAQQNAADTISDLQSRGFSVTVNRIGSAPLSECTVTSVQESPQPMQILPLNISPGDSLNVFQLPQQRSAIVTVNCSRR